MALSVSRLNGVGVGAAAAGDAAGDPAGEAAGLTAGEAASDAAGDAATTGEGAATGETAALGAAAVVGLAAGGAVVGAAGAAVGVGGACEQPAIAAASATTTRLEQRLREYAKSFASRRMQGRDASWRRLHVQWGPTLGTDALTS